MAVLHEHEMQKRGRRNVVKEMWLIARSRKHVADTRRCRESDMGGGVGSRAMVALPARGNTGARDRHVGLCCKESAAGVVLLALRTSPFVAWRLGVREGSERGL